VEGISPAENRAKKDELFEMAEGRAVDVVSEADRAHRLQESCAFSWKLYELDLRTALFRHRKLIEASSASPEMTDTVEAEWALLAKGGAQARELCDLITPSSKAIGTGLVMQIKANMAAQREETAKVLARELALEFPERLEDIAACFELAELGQIRKDAADKTFRPLSSDPAPTGIAECDAYSAGFACSLRRVLPSNEPDLQAFIEESAETAANLSEASRAEKKAARARCKKNIELARQPPRKDWCFAPDYAAARKEGPAPPAPPVSGDFGFAWGAPCSVPVTETVTKNGKEVVLRYTVDLTRPKKGRPLEVAMNGMRLVSVDGKSVAAGAAAGFDATLAEFGELPTFVVDSKGYFVEVANIDRFIKDVATEDAAGIIDQDKFRFAMQEKLAMYWRSWVESWIGWDLAVGEHVAEPYANEQPTGRVAGTIEYERLPDAHGHAALRIRIRPDAETIKYAASALLSDELGAKAKFGAATDKSNLSLDMLITYYVETDPTTLRPRLTRREQRVEARVGEKNPKIETETREAFWNWKRAEGCH